MVTSYKLQLNTQNNLNFLKFSLCTYDLINKAILLKYGPTMSFRQFERNENTKQLSQGFHRGWSLITKIVYTPPPITPPYHHKFQAYLTMPKLTKPCQTIPYHTISDQLITNQIQVIEPKQRPFILLKINCR